MIISLDGRSKKHKIQHLITVLYKTGHGREKKTINRRLEMVSSGKNCIKHGEKDRTAMSTGRPVNPVEGISIYGALFPTAQCLVITLLQRKVLTFVRMVILKNPSYQSRRRQDDRMLYWSNLRAER